MRYMIYIYIHTHDILYIRIYIYVLICEGFLKWGIPKFWIIWEYPYFRKRQHMCINTTYVCIHVAESDWKSHVL